MLWRIAIVAWAGIATAIPVGCCTHTCGDGPLPSQNELLRQSIDSQQVGVQSAKQPTLGDSTDRPATKAPQRIHGSVQ